MPETVTVLRVLVASPSDLDDERRILDDVVRELNLSWQRPLGVSLELLRWETHVAPGVGAEPQAVIAQQLPPDYDILVAMFWTRAGTPTQRHGSGTLEEFENAYQRWTQDPQSVRLMMYFKTAPVSPDQIDPAQLEQVMRFRDSLAPRGILYTTFSAIEEFAQLVRMHLTKQVQEFLQSGRRSPAPSAPAAVLARIPSSRDASVASESTEDEGFLDLVETGVAASGRVSEVLQHLTDALENLNQRTEEATRDMQSIPENDKSKLAAYKRISNRQADNMADFTARLRSELPILDDSLSTSLDAYGRMIALLPDFGANPQTESQLQEALLAAARLKEAMVPSKEAWSACGLRLQLFRELPLNSTARSATF
ncbi:MAG: hypothetical protein MUQ00_03320 [Candidatus Aminicenantes bacterium]|nr:hypothetical protein [Candidatus Aminicenantes bacterium]